VRYQDFYFQECEVLSGLIEGAIRYYRKQGLEVPDRAEIYRLIEAFQGVTNKHSDFKKSLLSPNAGQLDDITRRRDRWDARRR